MRRFQLHPFALVALLAASLVTAPRSVTAQTAAPSAATQRSLAVRASAAETVAAPVGAQVVP